MVCRSEQAEQESVRMFRTWLQQQVAADRFIDPGSAPAQ
jgi:hypothetical protein